MPRLAATRGSQFPLVAEFTFNFNDTVINTSGVETAFSAVGPLIADVINLPNGATVIGGEVVTEAAVTGSTAYNVSVGDATVADRYLTATNRLAAGRSALTPTGYVGVGEQIRITVNPTVATATAGRITVRVQYVIRNRVNEVQSH
jgi:hypothetical protein